ncbi:MAG: lytic transglycosylase domain-containing protein [Bdellovibrionota bacterium]
MSTARETKKKRSIIKGTSLVLVLAFIPGVLMSEMTSSAQELFLNRLMKVKNEMRIRHAKELLGAYYRRSAVRKTEDLSRFERHIYQQTLHELPTEKKHLATELAQTIIRESSKHGFDPIFTMAVIRQESRFRADVIGGAGEIGLMQIKPDTAAWICEKLGIPWKGAQSLKDVRVNVQIGTAYLAFLKKSFASQGAHYLAAYNMGSSKLKRALAEQRTPKIYASGVMKQYMKLYQALEASIKGAAPQVIAKQ